ncbi:DUF479 domain-containing protein [bacterium]|nr:MAG: DUF479 domain-containing protein [bacterium]
MNFLAHALLSGQDGDVLLGNLMADFLGPGIDSPDDLRVQSGIERHYKIDHFMDSHPLVAQSRARLFPFYRHYSAVLVDVLYDHLLAINWERFCDRSLQDFAFWVYAELGARQHLMPARMKPIVPSMQADNWLVSYAESWGVRYALDRVHYRSRRAPTGEQAWETFAPQKALYEAEFLEFFPLIMKICE